MGKKGKYFIFIFFIFFISAIFSLAETTGHDGVNPEKLKASFGFWQFNMGVGRLFDPGMTLLMFGGRGGGYIDKSESFYIGGGGRGGFAFSDNDGGVGYGFCHAGSRGPLGNGNLGLDYYGGLGLGGYNTDSEDGYLFGPVLGIGLFFGVTRSPDYGIFLEGLINVLDINASMITLGIHTGGKGGSVYIDWEDRHDLD